MSGISLLKPQKHECFYNKQTLSHITCGIFLPLFRLSYQPGLMSTFQILNLVRFYSALKLSAK